MENKENIFLGKLEVMLSKFEELDNITSDVKKMIDENPNDQKNIDWLLSDYYHKLEDGENTDIELINIGKKIRDARLIRKDLQCLYEIIKCYNENKDLLFWTPKDNRNKFRKAIEYARKYLHEDYKYRVLSEEDIKSFKEEEKEEKEIKHRKRRNSIKISKEQLEECIAKGMKGIEMAKEFDVDASTISMLKRKYGLGTREYRKK